ncbi:MAG: hypothetical protein SFV18_07850 [Bryobacteraceae bacterium]|nr:hypothetical protein [Bryobacteraceae bacterium]
MKNITFSADEKLIEMAREQAKRDGTTLNEKFREWLDVYGGREARRKAYDELMAQLDYVQAGRKYTRDEMNER